MNYILFIIAIFVVIVWPIIKAFSSFSIRNKSLKYDSHVSNKNINMLIDFATLMSKHIKNNLSIDSPLIFYEQVYLLYFLLDIYSIGKNISKKYRDKLLNNLIVTLNLNHKLDYLSNKDDFKNFFIQRYKNYLTLLKYENYSFSEKFFDYVMEYQCLLIATIETKNKLSDITADSMESTDYEYDVESGSVFKTQSRHKEIKNILVDNIKLIDSFITQLHY